MLIYNHKKEFIGIDEDDLKALSISSIAELQGEASDFADLFVKSPGFVHNFKHVHWLDYIMCNEGSTDSKAIIKIKSKNYSTNIHVSVMYLLENPTQKAFKVELINLRSLSQTQEDRISFPPLTQKEPQKSSYSPKVEEESIYENLSPNIIKDPYEDNIDEASYAPLNKVHNLKNDIKDLDPKPEVAIKEKVVVKEKIEPLSTPLQQDHIEDDNSSFSNYSYDPKIASAELGLPIDLVEEFIQDFIAQAASFKSDLYDSLAKGDMDNLKIQSHKLKGVCANLRIEDALDALTIVNLSHDEYEIQKNLNRFYSIINKLSKNDAQTIEPVSAPKIEEIEDDFIISIKEDLPLHQDKALDLDVVDFIEEPTSLKIDEPKVDELRLDYDVELSDEETQEEAHDEPQIEASKIVLNYDKDRIAHEIGLDIDSFEELFNDYLMEVKNISIALNEALKKSNLVECTNAARKLKGMSENMRIHDFDLYLDNIISATDTNEIEENLKNIALVLNLISNTEDK